jgi:thiol-disulfide isomerase/thioredoxin
MRTEYTIFLVVLFGTIAIIVLRHLYNKYKPKKITIKPDSDSSVKKCEVIYFYTTWCPYCKKAEPEWESFQSYWAEKGNMCKGYYITFTKIDCDVDETTAKKYDVKSYPTIKLKCEGEVVDFDARPNVEDLNNFLNTVLP